jgi:hypothetical protein
MYGIQSTPEAEKASKRCLHRRVGIGHHLGSGSLGFRGLINTEAPRFTGATKPLVNYQPTRAIKKHLCT